MRVIFKMAEQDHKHIEERLSEVLMNLPLEREE